MDERFVRTKALLGEAGMERLACARVAVFGVGGVGGHAAEALVRSGVGAIDLIDADDVHISNLNRQIIATESSVGRAKVDVAAERFLSINPSLKVTVHKLFCTADNLDTFDFSAYDYVLDAIDTVSAKIELIVRAKAVKTPVISSMGAGNKLDPTRFEVADISKTSVCPLARVMRRELKKRGVDGLKVVYSKEEPVISGIPESGEENAKKRVPASIAFVPSVAGLIMAGEVVKDLVSQK